MITTAIIVIASSLWVFYDSKKISKNPSVFEGEDMGPRGWLILCLFLWVIAFPAYIFKRVSFSKKDSKLNYFTPILIGSIFVAALIINLVTPLLAPDRLSTSELQDQVQLSILESFSKNRNLSFIKINSLTLIHNNGNHYNGILKYEDQGSPDQLLVDVVYDGNQFMWQIKN